MDFERNRDFTPDETIASQEYASIACDLLILSFYQFKVLVEYKSERIRK
jgi:hypothetical protein